LTPTRNDEYFIYQTLLGIWPLGEPDSNELSELAARVREYLIKALREAKVHTSWINPNTAYEEVVTAFSTALINAPTGNAFITDFRPFQRRIAWIGLFNSLSQTLIKLTAPGVPDIYQGCELWNFSLVDPDNRRPVDFDRRRNILRAIQTLAEQETAERIIGVRALCDTLEDGRAKMLVVSLALALRKAWPEVFQQGKYFPLAVRGEQAAHLFAYARIAGNRIVITVAPRFFVELLGKTELLPLGEKIWGNTVVELPFQKINQHYHCVFTGKVLAPNHSSSGWRLPVSQILAEFPVGLIVTDDADF
jgi:(1->4)-alpha-D-glucan 1-alpha-D-glucosylmutase